MKCTTNLDYSKRNYRFDEVVGPWFNFVQTASVFAWIGGIFGISASFRKIQAFEWYAGPWKHRIYRLIITNLFILPSWLFMQASMFEMPSWKSFLNLCLRCHPSSSCLYLCLKCHTCSSRLNYCFQMNPGNSGMDLSSKFQMPS